MNAMRAVEVEQPADFAFTPENLAAALRLAGFPEEIRGFGHVKTRSVERMRPQLAQWRAQWSGAPASPEAGPREPVRDAAPATTV